MYIYYLHALHEFVDEHASSESIESIVLRVG